MQKFLNKLYRYLSPVLPKSAGQFFSVSFCVFLAIGAINTLSTAAITSLLDYVFAITPLRQYAVLKSLHTTFILGYVLSLVMSFFLNCRYTFRKKPTVRSFLRFPVSYVPNFAVQYISVRLLADRLSVNPTLSYLIAAVCAVPITYVIMRIFVFKK